MHHARPLSLQKVTDIARLLNEGFVAIKRSVSGYGTKNHT